jgi:hypothetical protein
MYLVYACMRYYYEVEIMNQTHIIIIITNSSKTKLRLKLISSKKRIGKDLYPTG